MLRKILTTSFTALFFSDERLILIKNIRNIDNNILNLKDSRFSEVSLFGNSSFNNTKNIYFKNTTVEYVVSSKRFKVPLFDSFFIYSCMAVLCTSYYFHFFFIFFKGFFFSLGYFL